MPLFYVFPRLISHLNDAQQHRSPPWQSGHFAWPSAHRSGRTWSNHDNVVQQSQPSLPSATGYPMNTVAAATTPSRTLAVVTIGVLFFIFGFVTWLNGPLITYVKLAFDLDDVNAFLVPMAFYLSYFFLALPASWILARTGMKRGMALGLFVMAVGAALFGQFATMRIYPGALTGLFVIGAGLALLQTAANPYISILGPIESAAQRIAFMGICNKAAGILAPILLGVFVLKDIGGFADKVAAASGADKQALLGEFAAKVHMPYLFMAALLALLAVWIL